MSNFLRQPAGLDRVDEAILVHLATNARMPNNALADAVGIAPSTCLARVRSLQDRGVIRGYHADIDLAAIGLPLQAMVSVRLQAHTREQMDTFLNTLPRVPGVVAAYFMGGSDDYVIQVAMPSADALREFVLDHLSSNPAVQHTQTSLIFDQRAGRTPYGRSTS